MNEIEKFEAELKEMTDDEVLKVIENFFANTQYKGVEENSKELQIAKNELDCRMSRHWYDEEIARTQGNKINYSFDRMNQFC